MRIILPKAAIAGVFVATQLLAVSVGAAEVDRVLKVGASKTASAQSSQKRIDKLADQTYDILQDFRIVNKEIEGLQVYNAQLEKQLENQQQTMNDIADSIENATVIERQITPLSIKMLDALEQFVNLDLPFQHDLRLGSIAQVRSNLEASRFSSAEKFRQVLELYDIELEYGNTISEFSGLLPIDGQERQVTFFRVGRIALLYQSSDQSQSGVWDARTKEWQPLPSGEYRTATAKGIRIAKKQAAIGVLNLPISSPEVAQ
ncbi:hypothetical protein A9Q90_01050 [Gammaproteobacteria bacterium 54_18_T64]|nr:hypothetical protein A9Q90_01050 [Gammaproteobacteria bacterium 54_18_T64]